MSGGVVDYANAGFIIDGEAMSKAPETPYSIVRHGVAYVRADAIDALREVQTTLYERIERLEINNAMLEADHAALRRQLDAAMREGKVKE